nr:hypothetical protein [Mycobacterium simulans]
MHDVVADLHVFDDLGQTEGRRAGPPSPAPGTGRQDHSAGDLKSALKGDGAVDVPCIALTTAVLDLGADRVQLSGQAVNVCVGQMAEHRRI